MFDEVTRQQDHYWELSAYTQEKEEIEGIELGKEKEENVLISLIEGDCISSVVAAEKLNISIDELNRNLYILW